MVTQPYTSARADARPLAAVAERPKGPLILVAVLASLTLLLTVVSNGNVGAALAPTFTFLVVYVFLKVPLRYPWLVYIALVMSLDNPAEPFASGLYRSPLHTAAVALSGQLKNVIPVGALVISGLDVFLLVSFVLHGVRRARRSTLDRQGYTPTPFPLMMACWLAMAGMFLAAGLGLATGGSARFVQWQLQRNVYLPLTILLLQAIFTSPDNFRSYFKMLVGVACLRAVLAIVLRHYFPEEEYTSSHSDSMVFGTVVCLLIARWIHQPVKRDLTLGIPVFALLIWGMVANDRRIVWAELAFAIVFIWWMTPRSRFKVSLARAAIASSPFVIVYMAVGWNSTATIFKPVATVKSMVDSKSDGSSLWRDLENFNLVSTYGSSNPLTGRGFGKPFDMVLPLPDVTSFYELEPYLPHNSILGLWAFTGYIGFTLIWLIPVVGTYLAARSYFRATERSDRIAAMTVTSSLIIYALQCYGDMGLGSVISLLLLAPLLAMTGKLATKVGAWP